MRRLWIIATRKTRLDKVLGVFMIANEERRSINLSDISIDDELGIVTILGMRYTVGLLDMIARGEVNQWSKIIKREDGVATFCGVSPKVNEMIEQLVERCVASDGKPR